MVLMKDLFKYNKVRCLTKEELEAHPEHYTKTKSLAYKSKISGENDCIVDPMFGTVIYTKKITKDSISYNSFRYIIDINAPIRAAPIRAAPIRADYSFYDWMLIPMSTTLMETE